MQAAAAIDDLGRGARQVEHVPLLEDWNPESLQQPSSVHRGTELQGVDELIRQHPRERNGEGQKQEGKHQLAGEMSG
jgi:hypothetical protein